MPTVFPVSITVLTTFVIVCYITFKLSQNMRLHSLDLSHDLIRRSVLTAFFQPLNAHNYNNSQKLLCCICETSFCQSWLILSSNHSFFGSVMDIKFTDCQDVRS